MRCCSILVPSRKLTEAGRGTKSILEQMKKCTLSYPRYTMPMLGVLSALWHRWCARSRQQGLQYWVGLCNSPRHRDPGRKICRMGVYFMIETRWRRHNIHSTSEKLEMINEGRKSGWMHITHFSLDGDRQSADRTYSYDTGEYTEFLTRRGLDIIRVSKGEARWSWEIDAHWYWAWYPGGGKV